MVVHATVVYSLPSVPSPIPFHFFIVKITLSYFPALFCQLVTAALEPPQGSPERQAQVTGDRRSTVTIEELRRAFELVEVSNPGLGEQLVQRIVAHLQRG